MPRKAISLYLAMGLMGSAVASDILSLLPSNCEDHMSSYRIGNVVIQDYPLLDEDEDTEQLGEGYSEMERYLEGETTAVDVMHDGPKSNGTDINDSLPFFCECMLHNGVSLEQDLRTQIRQSQTTLRAAYNCTQMHSVLTRKTLHFPVYYSSPYRTVGAVFQGIVFLVGFLGNMMVVLVVHRSRSMHTPTNCYLVSLAVADIIVLIAAMPNEIFTYFLVAQAWVWGEAGCMFLPMLQYMGINASALSVTAFTVERYIAICRPLKARTVCTVQRAKRIIVAVWAFAFCYCVPWVFLTKIVAVRYIGVDDVEDCTFKLSRQEYLGYFFTDLVLFYVVPLLVSCVLYARIAVVVFRPPQALRQSGIPCVGPVDMKLSNSRAQVIKMLVMVVSLFALLWLPYRSLLVYNSFAATETDKYMDLWFLMFAKTCVYINSAVNPILYNAMSVKFRRAFRRAFHQLNCRKAAVQYNGIELYGTGPHRTMEVTAVRPRASLRGRHGIQTYL